MNFQLTALIGQFLAFIGVVYLNRKQHKLIQTLLSQLGRHIAEEKDKQSGDRLNDFITWLILVDTLDDAEIRQLEERIAIRKQIGKR